MKRIPDKEKRMVLIVSVVMGVALAVTALIYALFLEVDLILKPDQLIFLALLVGISPLAVVDILDSRWKWNVDKNIPEFLREVSEAGRTGITLTRAIELASQRRYGPLSAELNNIVVKLSWGRDLKDALDTFAERINTRLAKRTSIILSEIHHSGGDIKDVLDMVSKHIGELQTIEAERKSQLKIYVLIIYIAFFIFLFIDFLLLETFFASLDTLKEEMSEMGGGFFLSASIELSDIQRTMFHMSVIEGFFGGLVAGKMGEGYINAGLKHAIIMISVCFIAFYILVWSR